MAIPQPRNSRNREILLRTLEGQTPEEIALVYDLEPSTIKGILNSPMVQTHMARLQEELGKEILTKVRFRSHEALDTITDSMRGDINSELRFKAAKEILDRNPELKAEKDGGLKELGAGMGEAIIRALQQQRNQQKEPLDVGTGTESRGSGEGKSLALVS